MKNSLGGMNTPLGDKNESQFKDLNENNNDFQFKFFKNNKFEKGNSVFNNSEIALNIFCNCILYFDKV